MKAATGPIPVIRCSVPGCRNVKNLKGKKTNGPDLTFFNFPYDRRNQWAMAIGKPIFALKTSRHSYLRICSDHFQDSDFIPVMGDKFHLKHRKKLQPNAVPSLWLPSKKEDRGLASPEKSTESPQPPPLQEKKNIQSVKMKKENCLICSERTCTGTSGTVAVSRPLSGVHHKFNGSSGLHLLNEQLWSTYILLRILELPSWKFENILKTAGKNTLPSEWFRVCDVCSGWLVQLVEIEEKIRILQLQIEKVKNKLQTDFRRSLEEAEEGVHKQNDELAVRETIRNFFKNPVQTVEVKEESLDGSDMNFHSDDSLDSGGELSALPSEQEDDKDEIYHLDDDVPIASPESASSESPEQVNEKNLGITPAATTSINKPQKNLQVSKSNPCAKKRKVVLAKTSKHYDCSRCGLPLLTFGALSKHYRAEHKLRLDKKWKNAKASSSPQHFLADLSDLQAKSKLKRKKVKRNPVTKKSLPVENNDKKEKKLPCSECKMWFVAENGRSNHMRAKHPNSLETCEFCGFKEAKGLMKQHIFNHKIFDNSIDPAVSTTEFICNICKQLFKTRRQLSFHKVNTHAEELELQVYQCSYCARNFSKNYDCMYHEMRVHQKRGLFPCDQCDYEAVDKPRLKIHMSKHSDTPKICEYCSSIYRSDLSLRRHIRRHHPDKFTPVKKPSFVGVAVEKLSTEQGDEPTFNTLMRQKQREQKPINCKYCDAVLPHKVELNLHLKESHKDLYNYPCDLCDKVYLSNTSLQLHKKVNHREKGKPVKCGWCLKSIAHRLYLYGHAKTCSKRPKEGENIPKFVAIDENSDGTDGENNVCVEQENETIA